MTQKLKTKPIITIGAQVFESSREKTCACFFAVFMFYKKFLDRNLFYKFNIISFFSKIKALKMKWFLMLVPTIHQVSPNMDSVSVYTAGQSPHRKTPFVTLFKSYLCGEAETSMKNYTDKCLRFKFQNIIFTKSFYWKKIQM